MAAVLEHITEDTQIDDAVHSDVAIGDAHPDRQVVVVLNSRGTEPTAMTIGSVSAHRQKHEGFGSNFDASIWVADVPFGRTADITITGGDRYTAINVYRGVNVELYDAATDGDGGVDDSVAVTVDSGDASTVAGYHQEGAGGSITSWTGVTERSDASIDAGDANDTYSFADTLDDSTAGSLTVTATSTSSQAASALVAATFRSANVAREIVVESTEPGTSFACPKGTNLLAVVAADGTAQTGITYGGENLTSIAAASGYADIWVMKRPPINQTTALAGMTGEYYSICLSSVDLNSVIEIAENSVTSTSLTSFETQYGSLSDEVFLLDAFRLDSQVTPSVGSGQTAIETGSTADPEGWGFSYKTVDSSAFDSMSWTFASADEPTHAVAAFQPQRLKSPAYQYEEVEGTLSRIDFNYGANDQGLLRQPLAESGTMTYASGAAQFDGSTDYITSPTTNPYANLNEITFSMWIKPDTVGGSTQVIFHNSKDAVAGTDGIYMQWRNAGNATESLVRAYFGQSGGGWANADSADIATSGEWIHVCAACKGDDEISLTVNGVETTATFTGDIDWTEVNTWTLGRSTRVGETEYFDGDIADFRVFGRKLTNVEAQDLYARGRNNLPVRRKWDSDPDLVGHYTSKVAIGTDQSGNGYHLTNEDATPSAPETNGGLYFDGGNDWYSMNGISVDFPLTLALWVRADAASSMAFISSSSNSTAYIGTSTLDRYRFGWNGITQSLISIPSPVDGWHHVVQTIDAAGNSTYYIDGAEAGTGTGGTSGAHTLQLGKVASFGATMNGAQDDIRIYKRVLTNSEIRELYKLTDRDLNLNSDPPQRRQLHGCVGHWTAATEGRDLSGNGNHATYEGGASVNGGVFELDGTDDYAQIDHASELNVPDSQGALSVSGWVKTTDTTSRAGILVKRTTDDRYGVYLENGTLGVELSDGTNAVFSDSTSTINDGAWYHFVAIWDRDSDTQYVYVDGVLEDSDGISSVGSLVNSNPLMIGSENNIAGRYVAGSVDDIQVYNRALTNGEVTALYQSGVPYYERPERRKLTGEAFHISASEGAVQLSDGAGVAYSGDVSIVDNEYEFDGTGDFITTDYQIKPPFTILTWLDTDQTSSIAVAIGTEENSRTRIGTTTSNRWMFEWSSASSMLINGATTGLHLLALTVDSSGNAEAFEDGVSIGTSTGASTSTATLKIGRTFTTTTQDWDGSIADVKVYERILNPEEIAIEYNNGTPGYEPSVNHLEAPYQAAGRWCPTLDTAGSGTTTLTCLTDHGNNGTLTNMDAGSDWVANYEAHGEAELTFDATDDYVTIADDDTVGTANFNQTDGFTVAQWINTSSPHASSSFASIKGYGTAGESKPWWGIRVTNAGYAGLEVRDTSNVLFEAHDSTTEIDDGSYHNVLGTYDPTSSGITTFIDGVSKITVGSVTAEDYGTNTGDLEIGGTHISRYWAFNTDDFILLPRVAHSGEVNWISSERGIQRPLDPYNPVAWWCPSLDFPNAGTDYLMDLARDQHGTLTDMVAADDWVVSTERGGTRALDFDGTNDYVDVGSGLFNGWTQFTVATWMYADVISLRETILAQVGDGSNYNFAFGPGFNTAGGANKFVCSFWTEGVETWRTWVNTDCPSGEWIHYAAVWDGVEVKMFANGVEDTNVFSTGTANSQIQAVTSPLNANIGKYERSPGYHFDGKVDDLRVYDKALPIEAIKNLASKRGWTPEETTTITTAGDAAPSAAIFPFWAIIDNNNSFG